MFQYSLFGCDNIDFKKSKITHNSSQPSPGRRTQTMGTQINI